MNKPVHIFQTWPFYIFLLSVLFVLHGFRENFDFVPVGDALMLTGVYLIASIVLLTGFWLLFRDWRRAALLAFVIMAWHFFFGSMHDWLKEIFPGSFITKYSVLVPGFGVLLAVLIYRMKKKKPLLLRTTYYLNFLLLLLIALDVVLLFTAMPRNKKNQQAGFPADMVSCD